MPPNTRLREVRERMLRMSRDEFARAIREKGLVLGEPVASCDTDLIKKWEAGKVARPSAPYRRVVTALTGRTEVELGWDSGRLAAAVSGAVRPDIAAAGHLAALVDDFRRRDDTAPTGSLLDAVGSLAALADRLADAAAGDAQIALGRVAAQAAQLQWWLAVDAGHHDDADVAYRRAMAAAVESGLTPLVGYLLAGRAGHALSRGDLPAAVRLARQARESRWSATPGAHAWASLYEARAHAMAGDADDLARAVDVAQAAYAAVEPAAEPPWLYWMAGPVLGLDALDVVMLREGAGAIPALRRGLEELPAERIRDRAWYRARIAAELARAGDVDTAAADAADIAQAVGEAGTTWVLAELRLLAERPGMRPLADALAAPS